MTCKRKLQVNIVLPQILTFMRADTKVDGSPVVVIWVSKAVKYASSHGQSIHSAVRACGIGKTQEKRDFLKSGSTDSVIMRKVNSVRQSCVALYLEDPRWPPELLEQLKKG